MQNEVEILNNIEKNKNSTQRDIAKNTGMSLGNVNILIKRLVRKGMLKVERLTPKTIRYILTPEGLKEKAEATYRYVVKSYRFINNINDKIDFLLNSHKISEMGEVILFGDNDEICEMLEEKFNKQNITYVYTNHINDIKANSLNTVFVWHPNYIEQLMESNMEFVNLLDNI